MANPAAQPQPQSQPQPSHDVFMAKVAEQAGQYDDMLEFLQPALKRTEELAMDERNLLSVAYKNLCGNKRTAWRTVASIEENPKYEKYHDHVKMYKSKVETDLKKICKDVIGTIDSVLMPKAAGAESKSFYLKMKADYFRYMGEVCTGTELEEVSQKAMASYEAARKAAEELPANHAVRLGLALNFSVFQYELRKNTKEALKVAKVAHDEGVAAIPNLEDEKHKEAAEIIQLLRENMTQWTAEAGEEEQQPPEKKEA